VARGEEGRIQEGAEGGGNGTVWLDKDHKRNRKRIRLRHTNWNESGGAGRGEDQAIGGGEINATFAISRATGEIT